ncbi:hypothetical protein [Oceanibaculum indicum]|uniref:Uncharacterized protein n=1 Tax=Oceanibaculum indicum TaxID=526216 RepID=A0A420WGP9_9PROT|nr:hypothetical protein [Oceanibaculum indicum]RKQ70171.1 hypothetical protein BCL74_2111 [Oceanibaculum indicum]
MSDGKRQKTPALKPDDRLMAASIAERVLQLARTGYWVASVSYRETNGGPKVVRLPGEWQSEQAALDIARDLIRSDAVATGKQERKPAAGFVIPRAAQNEIGRILHRRRV